MNIPPMIQTPANEEKYPKRNREEASNSTVETLDEMFRLNKRRNLNLLSKKEENIASEEIIDSQAMGKKSKETDETIALGETQQKSTSNT